MARCNTQRQSEIIYFRRRAKKKFTPDTENSDTDIISCCSIADFPHDLALLTLLSNWRYFLYCFNNVSGIVFPILCLIQRHISSPYALQFIVFRDVPFNHTFKQLYLLFIDRNSSWRPLHPMVETDTTTFEQPDSPTNVMMNRLLLHNIRIFFIQ